MTGREREEREERAENNSTQKKMVHEQNRNHSPKQTSQSLNSSFQQKTSVSSSFVFCCCAAGYIIVHHQCDFRISMATKHGFYKSGISVDISSQNNSVIEQHEVSPSALMSADPLPGICGKQRHPPLPSARGGLFRPFSLG
jgi:hypothetical protein